MADKLPEPMEFDEWLSTLQWANDKKEPLVLEVNSWQLQFILTAMNKQLVSDILDRAIISPAGQIIEQIRNKRGNQ